MGMFDDIRCDIPLPNGDTSRDFQTKSLSCQLRRYSITARGRLVLHVFDTEITEEMDPLFGLPRYRKVLGSDRTEDQECDGDVEFYYADAEYRATFRYGACVEICRYRNRNDWEQVWKCGEDREGTSHD